MDGREAVACSHVRRVLACCVLAVLLLLASAALAAAATFAPISDPSGYRLVRHGIGPKSYARVARLARAYPQVGIARLLDDPKNHLVAPLGSPAELEGVSGVEAGFRWTAAGETSAWYPQGITGAADASPDGYVAGHRVIGVSWYSRTSLHTRVTFVTVDSFADARFRHVLLVAPTSSGGFSYVKVHAGGIAWFGHLLYVADTHHGLRVFDTDRLLYVPAKRRSRTSGYKYLLPQVGHYEGEGRTFDFSYVSVDRSSSTPTLLAGEYRNARTGRRS